MRRRAYFAALITAITAPFVTVTFVPLATR